MPRKDIEPSEEFVPDASPSRLGTHKDVDLRISETAMTRMRLCVKAAQMRAAHKTFRQIAVALGLSSPAAAQIAVKQGLSVLPEDNLQDAHRMQVLAMDRAARKLLAVAEEPGPLVSQGKIIWKREREDPADAGEPYPDNTVRVQALQAYLKALADMRKFRGLDAPRRSVSLLGEIPVADLQAHLAQLRAELGIPDDTEPAPQPPALSGAVLDG